MSGLFRGYMFVSGTDREKNLSHATLNAKAKNSDSPKAQGLNCLKGLGFILGIREYVGSYWDNGK